MNMRTFDLDKSMRDAELRLSNRPARRSRSDAGASRLPDPVNRELHRLLLGFERPSVRALMGELQRFCRRRRLGSPSRATIYNFMARCPPHEYPIRDLPDPVRAALYNLDLEGSVPGHQLAFYAFQYGDTRAASFAAGLPWLDLYQADRMRGWRPRTHGLLRAALRRRGIA